MKGEKGVAHIQGHEELLVNFPLLEKRKYLR